MSTRKSGILNWTLFRLTFMILLSILLVSCLYFPLITDCYRPKAPFGKLVKSEVQAFLITEVDDVVIGFEAFLLKDKVNISITFEIPENHSVKLIDDSVEIKELSGAVLNLKLSGKNQISSASLTSIPYSVSVPLDTPMQGYTGSSTIFTSYGKTKHAFYFFKADMPSINIDKFILKPPRLYINGVQVDLPDITFTKKKRLFILPLNS